MGENMTFFIGIVGLLYLTCSIYSNSSHYGQLVGSPNMILKVDTLGMIMSNVLWVETGLVVITSRGDDLES